MTSPLSPSSRARLEELLEAGTPGPWHYAALIVAAVNFLPDALAALRAVEELAERRDSRHAAYCCTVDCPDGGRHPDPTDPVSLDELVGILGDNPPPLREHRTVPCPAECTCPAGPDAAEIRSALLPASPTTEETNR